MPFFGLLRSIFMAQVSTTVFRRERYHYYGHKWQKHTRAHICHYQNFNSFVTSYFSVYIRYKVTISKHACAHLGAKFCVSRQSFAQDFRWLYSTCHQGGGCGTGMCPLPLEALNFSEDPNY